MSTIRADATAKPRDYVRELRVGGHDMVEDQWRGEMDGVTTALLNNQVSLNPGLMVAEAITLAGAETFVTAGKAISSLVGVLGFLPSGELDITTVAGPLGITAAAADVDQVANPGKVNLTGTVAAGKLLVLYVA